MASKSGNGAGKNTPGRRGGKATPSGVSVTPPASVADERKAKRAEAVAAMKREQSRRQTRSRLLMASGVVLAVVIVVAVGVYVGLNKTSSPATAAGRETAPASVVQDLTSVPAATFDAVGVGDAIAAPRGTGNDTPYTVDGKPYFLYVGAEFCPYCAAERWAMATSLARFGTFSRLKETESSSTDVYPSTQTLSFYGATYSSTYLTFKAVETQTNTGKPLESLSGADATIEKKYNYPPYVSGQGGSIPFVDIANQYVSSGATLDAGVLKGLSHAQIAGDLKDPDSKVAKAVDGASNLFTAAICDSTGGQPSAVCSSAGVQAAAKALASSSSSK